jgi:predicted Zn-dependent protease
LADDYGVFLRKTGRGGEGEKLLQDMIANSTGPEKHEAMMRLSDLYRRQHRYNQAGLLLVEVLKENPDHRPAGVMIMNLYVEMERYEDAIDIARQLHRDEDSEYLMSQHIEILLKAGRDDEAELLLEQMRKSYPDSMNTPFLAANLAMRKTNYVEAVAYTDQIIAKDPKKSYAYLLKGMALFYQDTEDHLQKAMETLKQLRNIEPSESVLGRDVLAEVYWRLGYYDDAISELKAVLSQYPDDMKLRNRLISKLKRRGRWSELDKFIRI